MSQILLKTGFVFVLISALNVPVVAQEESPWQEGDFAKARLITNVKSVPGNQEGLIYLGLHIQLEPGWKTYWRTPGSAGLPPQFNWEGSENIANVKVLYPAPDRFEIFDLHTYGYHDDVVYPILITPEISGAPITIKVKVNYLVCKDLCVPVSNTFELNIPAADGIASLSIHAGLIDQFLAMVPDMVAGGGDKIQILEQRVLGAPGAQNILLHIQAPGLMSGADLIIEDMEGFKFGVPRKRLLADASEAEFIIPVFAQGEGASLLGKDVVLVVVDGWENFEEMTLKIQK
ncbi:MAG: protein-disulfide reductase DsbD domain-containing protein [Sphingomonadales bacterium]